MGRFRYTGIMSWLFLILMVGPLMATAVTNHGLTWGVEEGDRVDYVYTRSSPGVPTITKDFYIIVNSLDPIPDNVTRNSWLQLYSMGSLNLTQYYANGTLVPFGEFGYGQIYGFPIGNWSLIQDFYSQDVDWINSSTEWGYSQITDDLSSRQTKRIVYSKTDGLVNQFMLETYLDFGTEDERLRFRSVLTRKGYGFDNTYLLLLFAGILIVVVVIFVIRRK